MADTTPDRTVADAIERVLAAEQTAAAALAAADEAARLAIEAARDRRRQLLEQARQRVLRLHAAAEQRLAARLQQLEADAVTDMPDAAQLRAVASAAIAALAERLTTEEVA
jgi:predicted RNase H-like HicB family nuclease